MSWTSSPSRPLVVVFDGHCRFCTAASGWLKSFARPDHIRLVSSKDEAELAKYPQVTPEALGKAIQLVSPDGDLAQGGAAIARALNTRPAWRVVTWLYWVPGLRRLWDWLYAQVAKRRYNIAGTTSPCENGACPVDFSKRPAKRAV